LLFYYCVSNEHKKNVICQPCGCAGQWQITFFPFNTSFLLRHGNNQLDYYLRPLNQHPGVLYAQFSILKHQTNCLIVSFQNFLQLATNLHLLHACLCNIVIHHFFWFMRKAKSKVIVNLNRIKGFFKIKSSEFYITKNNLVVVVREIR
jgi:hypothetical protein